MKTFNDILLGLCLLGLCSVSVRAAGPVWVVEQANGKKLNGELVVLNEASLKLKRPDETYYSTDLSQVLSLGPSRVPAGREQTNFQRLNLLNGERFVGKVSSYRENKIIFSSNSVGDVEIRVTEVRDLSFSKEQGGEGAGEQGADKQSKAKIYLQNGDNLEGRLAGMSGKTVTFEGEFGKIDLELGMLQRIVFGKLKKASAESEGRKKLFCKMETLDGDILLGLPRGIVDGRLDFSRLGGHRVKVMTRRVSRILVRNGAALYLSEMTPTAVKQVPFFDFIYPYQKNLTVLKRHIRLEGKSFENGLGVHSSTALSYDLEGKFHSFNAIIGIADEVRPLGSVIFRVYGDKKKLFESGNVTGRDAPQEVQVDLTGVHKLVLAVDYGEDFNICDHAVWANARVNR